MTDIIAEFWDDRASLEGQAGTQDLIAKQLEVEAIAKYVKDGMRVLDAGCGNGLTALELARRYDIEIVGIDSSAKMINAALPRAYGNGSVEFLCVDVLDLPDDLGMFDLIYTERTLINLLDESSRNKAMTNLCGRLKPDGLYVMCENSQDGVDRLNRLRVQLGLPEIVPPWHNSYLNAADIQGFIRVAKNSAVILDAVDHYSSTYYFLSRIVNAALAAQEGREPEYDSPINKLALKLPAMGDLGQGRIWLWRRI